jgi:hypothetical protein
MNHTAEERAAFWKDLAGLKRMVRNGFPHRDSPWTGRGKTYVTSLARYKGDPEAYVSSPAEAKEVLKRQGRLGPQTEIEAVR